MSSSCPSHTIIANSDIVGIGTRINFYATILLISLIPETELMTELLDGLYENSVFLGLGLVITAVVQTLQNQLDLYHAIFVMQIIFSLDFVYAYGMRRFFRSKNTLRATLIITVQMLSTAVFTIWVLYVWAQNAHFGSQPECNHVVKYVLFFASVNATVTWLRTLFIAGIVFAACSLLYEFSTIVVFVKTKSFQQCSDHAPNSKPTGTREKSNLKGLKYLSVVSTILSAIYGVTTLELIVQRNRVNVGSGEDALGFGQILSLILILQSVVDSVETFHKWRKEGNQPNEEV